MSLCINNKSKTQAAVIVAVCAVAAVGVIAAACFMAYQAGHFSRLAKQCYSDHVIGVRYDTLVTWDMFGIPHTELIKVTSWDSVYYMNLHSDLVRAMNGYAAGSALCFVVALPTIVWIGKEAGCNR